MTRSIPLVVLVVGVAAAQAPPTFTAGTRLVQVDTIVRNGHGPVTGLTKDDFVLLDNGKPQKIAVFSVRSARNPEVKSTPLPPGAVSNRFNRHGETPASATILLIDRLNTPITDQPFANKKVIQFLEARGNKDSIGVYTLGEGLRIIQDLTDDPDRLDRAVKSLKPHAVAGLTADVKAEKTGDAVGDAMIARSLESLVTIERQNKVTSLRDALVAVARHLAKVPGRKNLVWVSGSFPLFIPRPHDTALDFTPEMEEAARALNDANVAIYPVDSRGLVGTLSLSGAVQNAENAHNGCNAVYVLCMAQGRGGMEPQGFDTMNTLAALTGGRAFYNTNGIEDSIAQAVEDAELTYTLGFYPDEGSLDGKFHKLSVKVSRSGSVHYRGGYIASKTALDSDQGASLGELVRDPLEATAIGLLAQAAPDAAKPGAFEVRVKVDLQDLQLARENARRSGSIDVSFFVEGTGKALTKTIKIDIPEEQFASALEKGIVTAESIAADGKANDLRVVVQDRTTGAAGSVTVPLK